MSTATPSPSQVTAIVDKGAKKVRDIVSRSVEQLCKENRRFWLSPSRHVRALVRLPRFRRARRLAALPDSVDNSVNMLPPRDQGDHRMCGTFAFAGMVEAFHGLRHYLSVEQIERQHGVIVRSGDLPFLSRPLLSRMQVVAEQTWPLGQRRPPSGLDHQPSWRVGPVIRASRNPVRLAEWLAANPRGTVMTGVKWVFDEVDSTGQLRQPRDWAAGMSHAILLVGYKKQKDRAGRTRLLFKFRNSWGTGWGDHGYGWIDEQLLDEYGAGAHDNRAISTSPVEQHSRKDLPPQSPLHPNPRRAPERAAEAQRDLHGAEVGEASPSGRQMSTNQGRRRWSSP